MLFSSDFSTHQSASEENVLQEKLEAANRMCQEKDQEISQLKTKLQSQEAEIVSLRCMSEMHVATACCTWMVYVKF